MRKSFLFWVLFAITMSVYLTMILWSLPNISNEASGMVPFDLRPGGYSFEEAIGFLTALSVEGRQFYLDVQHGLDFAYPILLAATLGFAIYILAPGRWGSLRLVLSIMAIPSAVFDYLENQTVAQMLRLNIEAVTSQLVEAASRWTVLKSMSTTLAAAILLVLLAMWAWQRFKNLNPNQN